MPKRRANGEGSIYKRKDGTWAAQYTDLNGKKRYLYGKTQQIVKEKLKEAIRQNDSGIVVDTKRVMFSDWVMEWLDVYVRPVVRQSTYGMYYKNAELHIYPYFRKVPLKDVRAEMLQRFLNEKMEKRLDGRPGGYSWSICHKVKVLVKTALDKAVILGYIPSNPADKVRIPPEKRTEKKVLTKEHQKAYENLLLEGLDSEPNDFIFLLILYTGLRIGEATGLQIGDIDLEKRELHVRRTAGRITIPGGHLPMVVREPKTEHGRRTVPLSPLMVKMIRQHIERRNARIELMREIWETKEYFEPEWIEQEYLFITVYGNLPDHSKLLVRQKDMLKKLGIPLVTLHGLRHTFATRWIEAGLDVKSLADILGHADAKMTLNVYAHSLPDQKRTSMDKLAELYGE